MIAGSHELRLSCSSIRVTKNEKPSPGFASASSLLVGSGSATSVMMSHSRLAELEPRPERGLLDCPGSDGHARSQRSAGRWATSWARCRYSRTLGSGYKVDQARKHPHTRTAADVRRAETGNPTRARRAFGRNRSYSLPTPAGPLMATTAISMPSTASRGSGHLDPRRGRSRSAGTRYYVADLAGVFVSWSFMRRVLVGVRGVPRRRFWPHWTERCRITIRCARTTHPP